MTAGIGGHVKQLSVQMGDSVARGALIAEIYSTVVTPEDLAIAEADLRVARADVERLSIQVLQARARLTRFESLNREGLISSEALEEARYEEQFAAAAIRSAEIAVEQKQAAVARRKTEIAELELRAPFTGVVAVRYVDRGENVGLGSPIVRLVRTTPLWVRFAVPAAESAQIRIGQSIVVHMDERDAAAAGVVRRISPEVDDASQMIFVEALLDVPMPADGAVLAGQSVRVCVGGA